MTISKEKSMILLLMIKKQSKPINKDTIFIPLHAATYSTCIFHLICSTHTHSASVTIYKTTLLHTSKSTPAFFSRLLTAPYYVVFIVNGEQYIIGKGKIRSSEC